LGLLVSKLLLVPVLLFGGNVAQPSFEAFMWAISQQESGGNYSVVNSYGAVGKYQVLKSNIPGWSKRVLGYSITWQKFRDSPALQEQIVKGILKGYYNKYGARGAAAAWYAGEGNHGLDQSTHSQPGGPSIKSYVDSVISRTGGYKGGSSKSATSASTSAVAAATKLTDKELAEQYGFVSGLMNSNPELKNLFNQAVSGGWTAQKFQAELRDTKWWKTHSQSERDFLVMKYGDPATADQKLAQARTKVSQMAKQLGLTGPAASGANMSSYAYLMAAKGYDEAQIRYLMGQKITMGTGGWGGEAGQAANELQSYAYSMGINWSTSRLQPYLRNIVAGTSTVQEVKGLMAKEAKAAFPQWSKQIDGGQTVADIASPYMQSMSQILELPQGSVNLFDPTVRSALAYKNPTTLQSEPEPLWAFENKLRSDPRWRKTQNAQNSMMQVAHQVLADFGVKY
jgi:hypothetical protein